MRIARVHAGAFGPLQGAALELAPGLTVIHGPNESGKSSWHAALYAGLCGLPRGRGSGNKKEVKQFTARHRPWDGGDWCVTVEVALDDGRCLEIHQDLDGKVDSRVTDRTTGRDLASDLIFEGAPDGSRLLDLDRRTFLSTVCVRQADIVGVLSGAEGLQEQLQRAAATGGRDANAEEAIRRIAEYRSDHVGLDRANSTKPLRAAMKAKAAAEDTLLAAVAVHDDYLGLVRRRDRAEHDARQAEQQLDAVEAAVAHHRLDDHLAEAPTVRHVADGDGPTVTELRQAADDLEATASPVDAALDEEVAGRGSAATGVWRRPAVVAAGTVALAAVLAAAGQVTAALVALVAAAALGGVAFVRRPDAAAEVRRVAQLEARLALQREVVAHATARREAAERRCAEWGLDGDPSVLRRVAYDFDAAAASQAVAAAWQRRTVELEAAVAAANARLGAEHRRDVRLEEDLDAQVERLDAEARGLRHQADLLAGQVADRERQLPSVAEAEEALADTERELARVRRLNADLTRAQRFLEAARDRVHRDIAPVLADAVTRRLPGITAGRYVDAIVDPATLEVHVHNTSGKLRQATLLSHGTTEQIYLLLRLAMAEHLVTTGESAPFILDDALVQTDSARAAAVLDLLHELSADRQVIVFSQEDDVLAWARTNLRPGRDTLVELSTGK
ncbi:MAG: AAA family ATPase [Actinobacteria bacterium]|nr:AAA family ATPase [Actinomycetota bacterium]